MIKYDVVCPLCCGIFHETNGRFRKDVPAKGDMFDTKPHVKDAGWSTFPPYDTTEYANIVCPSCDAQYLDDSGRVIRLVENGECDEIVTLPSLTEKHIPTSDELNTAMEALMAEYDPPVPTVEQVAEPAASRSSDDNQQNGKVNCPVCGKLFQERGLRVHIAAIHPEAVNG